MKRRGNSGGLEAPDGRLKVANPQQPAKEPAGVQTTYRATGLQQRVRRHLGNADSYAMFNLLTGPESFDRVEALVPEHRERLFPPTETLSMFLAQALSADGSCRQVVNDAMVKRVVGGMTPGSTDTGATVRRGHACRFRPWRAKPAGFLPKGPPLAGIGRAGGCVWSTGPR